VFFSVFTILALLALLTAAALALAGTRAATRTVAVLDAFARRPALAVATCAAVSFVGSALVAWLVMWPEPKVHDEMSHLLAADTFAHGRLANPQHPLWQHFESFHILHEPTYASKYPPAQGLMLALGQVIAHPILGLWLGGAAMSAALCWMLYGFVGAFWAGLVGLAAALQIGVGKYWTQTYWGGTVAAAGGALVLGAAVRLARAPRGRDSFLLGLGMVVLANSRPMEGAMLAVVALAYVLIEGRRRRSLRLAAFAPAAGVLVAGALAMAYYNHAVVGVWWKPPYIHHEQLYAVRPLTVFQGASQMPRYRHLEICRFYAGRKCLHPDLPLETKVTSRPGQLTAENLDELREFFLGRVFVLPLVVGLLSLVQPGAALAAASAAAALAAMSVSTWFRVHYLAPFAGAAFALVAIGLERLQHWRVGGRPLGAALCAASLAGLAGSALMHAASVGNIHTSWGTDDYLARRAAVMKTLADSPGPDLVVVRYGPRHRIHREWVYNGADIDAAHVVWARDMGAQNRKLLEYFRGRRVWLLKEGFSREEDGLAPYPD
jgi:hypothetical protein